MSKRTWAVFLAATTFLITGFTIFLLYNSREAEKKIRVQKEVELSKKMVELTEKQGQISTLLKQKLDLEEQFHVKIASLETTIKDYEENSKAAAARMEAVLEENETLKRDLSARDKKMSDLTRRMRTLESDKTDLLESLSKKATAKATENASSAVPAGDERPAVTGDFGAPEVNPVKLGKIVVQKSSGRAARVEHIDKLYGFIVINAGAKDGLRANSVVNIVRGNKLIGKAVVQKVRPDISAATVMSEWTRDEIKVGDMVSRFS